MSSDQCALNADSSLKDVNNIQWFIMTIPPFLCCCFPTSKPGVHNKAINQSSDAVAHEQFNSDEELGPFTEPPSINVLLGLQKFLLELQPQLSL